jgi:nitronate monooxygenase
MTTLMQLLGIETPIVQAPMASTATPALAVAVSNAGGLGSIGIGPVAVEPVRAMIHQIREATDRPFHVNLFCNRPASADPEREAAWIAYLAPFYARFGVQPPSSLIESYASYLVNDAMHTMVLEERPPVVSFHFGLPDAARIAAFHNAGIVLMASATNLDDARAIEAAGIDVVIAQGIEAGGHRGVFDPDLPDQELSTFALTRLLVRKLSIPVIAAGGIMDGAGIAACLALGAGAAQLGTAFISCPESAADEAYRAALLGEAANRTQLTKVISGRPARGIVNDYIALGEAPEAPPVPDYPIAYDAERAMNAAAKAAGDTGYAPQWAGQGATLSRAMPAAELMAVLRAELDDAIANLSQFSRRD